MYVCGRAKDLIIIRGCNYYPQDIEQACCRSVEVKQGSVAAFSVEKEGEEVLVIAFELRRGTLPSPQLQEQIRQIRQQVTNEIGVAVYELVVLQPKTIIKTTSGKIARHAIRQAYEQNKLSVFFRDRWEERTAISQNFVNPVVGYNIPLSTTLTPSSISTITTANEANQVNRTAVDQDEHSFRPDMESKKQVDGVEITLPSVIDGINTLALHGE